jgi:hypothetical protein
MQAGTKITTRSAGSHRGGEKKESQQKEIVTDLSKFLYHSSPDHELDLKNVVKMNSVSE